jgi:hypothetical protein
VAPVGCRLLRQRMRLDAAVLPDPRPITVKPQRVEVVQWERNAQREPQEARVRLGTLSTTDVLEAIGRYVADDDLLAR